GVSSVEVRLTRHGGHPHATVGAGPTAPAPTQSYIAAEGGHTAIVNDDGVATVQAPSGVYTVVVAATDDAQGGHPDASFDLDVVARGEETLAFNGGAVAISGQESGTWRYFRVEVPDGALGWDLRVENVSSGRPQLAIRRDELPEALQTNPTCCPPLYQRGEWESGSTWAPSLDMTQRYPPAHDPYDDEHGRRVQMGMGAPLEPGVYYVGVSDVGYQETGLPMSYELVSRGIGVGDDGDGAPWRIQVVDLAFDGGEVT
ncbi:MAG: hypothetical protein KC635_14605, partial [Myxococcales bacterium]|nr:hypothetical protein [Myxococcales bacterium]